MVKVIEREGKKFIWDQVRKKELSYQPEEFQRQRLIELLSTKYDYPLSLFSLESGINVRDMQKRYDLVVFNSDGNPWLLAECKSESVKLGQEALLQLSNYNSKIKAPVLILFNGVDLYCWGINKKGEYQQLADIPPYSSKYC